MLDLYNSWKPNDIVRYKQAVDSQPHPTRATNVMTDSVLRPPPTHAELEEGGFSERYFLIFLSA